MYTVVKVWWGVYCSTLIVTLQFYSHFFTIVINFQLLIYVYSAVVQETLCNVTFLINHICRQGKWSKWSVKEPHNVITSQGLQEL